MALSFPVRVSCAFAQIRWWVADSSSWRSDIFIAPNLCVRKDFYANTSISWYHYWIIHLYNLIQLSKSIQTHLGTANSNLQEHLLIPNFWTSIKAFFCGRNRCFTPSQCRRGLANVPRLVVWAVRAMATQVGRVPRVPRVPRVLFAWELRVSRWPSCNASKCVGKDDGWGVLRLRWLPVTWRKVGTMQRYAKATHKKIFSPQISLHFTSAFFRTRKDCNVMSEKNIISLHKLIQLAYVWWVGDDQVIALAAVSCQQFVFVAVIMTTMSPFGLVFSAAGKIASLEQLLAPRIL